jgi:HPP family
MLLPTNRQENGKIDDRTNLGEVVSQELDSLVENLPLAIASFDLDGANSIDPTDADFLKLAVWIDKDNDNRSESALENRSNKLVGAASSLENLPQEFNQNVQRSILEGSISVGSDRGRFSDSLASLPEVIDIYTPPAPSTPNLLKDWQERYRRLKLYMRRSHRRGRIYQPKFSFAQGMLSWVGSLVAIEALVYLSACTHYPLMAAPFGATAVLVYGVPESPLSQPRNIIGGNCIGAIVSILLTQYCGSEPWVMGLAVAMSLKIMKLTRTLHPPGGAIALVGVMSHASWNFLLAPALIGSLIIVLWTSIFNNLAPGRSYPRHWL